tara:strand:+ start:5358 stop:5576 length:219 start_codon:yes stop_codon:yes gene_type:complete
MAKTTNEELKDLMVSHNSETESYRDWTKEQLRYLREDVSKINGRVRKTENAISWFKGFGAVIIAFIGWLFQK